jgi:hypothetical protein
VENQCDICGKSMGYLWKINGISVENQWDIYGISMGYIWNIYGIYMEYLWDIYIYINIYGIG